MTGNPQNPNSQSQQERKPLPIPQGGKKPLPIPGVYPSSSGDGVSLSGSQPQQFNPQQNIEEVKQDYLSVWDDVPQEFQQFSETTGDLGVFNEGNRNLPKFNAFVPKAAVDAMYTASINTPSPNPVMRNYTSNLLREGVKSYNRGVATGLTATNMRQPTPDLGRVAELQKIVQENAPEGSYSDFANSETVGQSLVEFAKDPLGVLTALTTESLASQAGALGGTDLKVVGAGALAGSVIPIAGTVKGAIAGLAFDNSLAIETASYLLQGLQEEGYDISDPESLEKAFTDYELVSRLKEKALAKGLPVAALDALSAGIAGSLGGKTIVRKMLREVPTQMALGGAGEAAGQIAAEGEITEPTAIVAEILGEIGGSAPEITTGIMTSKPELLMRPSSQTLDGRKLLDDTQVEMERDINNAPDWLKPELEAKLNQVIEAKNKLINKDAEFYSGFSDEDKSRVSQINQRLGEIADIFDSSELSEATKKVYEDEANNLFSEKMDIEGRYIESQTPSTEKVTTQQPKEQTDAIQEQETDEVDVRQQAGDGEKVGEEVRITEEETRGTTEGEVQEEIGELISQYEEAKKEFDIDDATLSELESVEMEDAYRQYQQQQEESSRQGAGENADKFTFLDYNLGRIRSKDFDHYGDRNIRKDMKGFNIKHASKKALPLDVIAQDLSDQFGQEITPQDIVDYIIDKERNPEKYKTSKAKQYIEASKIDADAQDAFETYQDLKNDPNAKEAVERLRGLVLSDQQADIIIKYLDEISKTKQQADRDIQQRNEPIERSGGIKEQEGATVKSTTPQKILGQTPSKTTKKVTMTDKALVKQRIQDMVKASREGYREGKREIKDLQSKVDEVLKTIPKKADFTPQQVRTISNLAKNVYTPSQLRRFEQTATKIIDDAEYASKLSEANQAKELIGKRGKSKNYPSNITKFFRDFSKINPKDVPDIDQYLFYANEAKRIIEKPKIKDGQVQETPQISIDEIRNEYINRHAYLSEQDAVASLLEDYQTLSSGDNPVIDATMTEDEIRSVIESVYTPEEKEGVTTDLKGLEKLIDYKLMEVEAIPSEGLTSAEKEQLDILKDANIQEMNFTRKELGEIYLYLQNYIKNGQLNNISSVTAKIAAKKNVNNILQYYKDKGLSPRTWIEKVRGAAFGTMAMTQLYEAVGGTQDMGAKIYEGTSTYEYAEKKVEAETQFFDKIKDYSNKFKKVKAVENTSDRADRQIYSFLAQVPSEKYQDALAFVDSSIQYYEEGFAGFESKKTGEIVRELFDSKYKGTSNINQVKISNDNKRIITWFRNLFAEIKDEYFENAEIVHNRTLEEKTEPGTYLPFTSRKKGKSKITEDSLDNPSSLLDQVIIPNRSGATNERKNEFNPKDRFMSFDFERSMFSAYENQLLDIKTSFTIKKIAAFFRLPESIDVFGSNELDRSFFNRTKEYVNNSFNSESLGDLENSMFRVLNYASNLSGRVALGGVDQAFKQSIPVLMNMMVNAGMQNGFQALIDYNDKDARATFRKSPVSRRSFVDQDTRKIYSNIPEAERKSFKGRIMKGFGVTDAMAEKIMMFAIQGSDKYAAQVSWLAYYKQARGENFKGWEQESKSPDRQSSAFADLMINNTQNVNDIDQQASWLKVKQDSSAGRYFSLIRRSALPFVSFTVNQIMDEAVQISKARVAPNEVAKRLGGRIMEQFAFAAIKKGLYAMYGAAALGLLSWLGIEYDDEEDKEGVSDFFAILAQGTLGSLPFYGVSGYVDAAIGTAVNKAYYNHVLSEKDRRKYSGLDGRSARGLSEKEIRNKLNKGFEKFMRDKPPVFVPSGDESLDLGMLSIGLDNHTADAAEFLRALEAYSGDEDFEYVTRSGNRIQMPLTEEEERAMVILSILENTDLALPNDIAKIAGKSKREITNRQFDKLYGSKGR